MIQSSAYVMVPGIDYQYHFCGVISIQHTFTSMKTYTNMVLTDFNVIQDEMSQSGWSGTLTFTQTNLFGWGKAQDNSSTIVNTASAGAVQTVSGSTVVSSGSGRTSSAVVLSPLQQMAQHAGVRL